MSGFKLYEISALLQQAVDAAELTAMDQETGEIVDAGWNEFLDACQMERDKKVLDCAKYVKSCDAEASAIREEEKKLTQRRKSIENRAEWMRGYITSQMQVGEKLQDTTVLLSWRKSELVDVENVDLLPSLYIRTKKEAAKDMIKSDLKCGVQIPGCKLVTKQSLQIK